MPKTFALGSGGCTTLAFTRRAHPCCTTCQYFVAWNHHDCRAGRWRFPSEAKPVFARRFRPFITVAVCMAVFSGSPRTRAQDVAEAARKAKAKKQQQHPDASSSPTATK